MQTKEKAADSTAILTSGKENNLNSIVIAENSNVKKNNQFIKFADICKKLNSENISILLYFANQLKEAEKCQKIH